eukprot:GSA120T00004620001.1
MLVMHDLASQKGLLMRIPHETRPLRVAQTELLLLVMQYRFFLRSKNSITSCNLPDPDIFAFDIIGFATTASASIAVSTAKVPGCLEECQTCHAVFGLYKNLYCMTSKRDTVCATRTGHFSCGRCIRKGSKNL